MNKGLVLLSAAVFTCFLTAKSQINDAGLWLSGNFEKNLSQSFGLSFTQELRLMENMSVADVVFSDLGTEYRFNKHFRFAVHYRWINNRRNDESYASLHRFYADLSYRTKFSPFIISVRERIQSEFAPFNSGNTSNPELFSRTKATVKLDLDRRISPYFYTELFNPLNGGNGRIITKGRYCLGFDYELNSRHKLDISYMIQHKWEDVPENDYIVGLGYTFSL